MIDSMTDGMLHYNQGQIYYKTAGSGDPIVFVHGFALDHTMWQPQVEFFSKSHSVITYDVRGFGKSSLPDAPYNHVADLYALLEHLKIEQANIVGLSMGGRIATNFTLAYPERIKSLTLMDSALDGYTNEVDWDLHIERDGLQKTKENRLNHEVFATIHKLPEAAAALHTMMHDYSGWHWHHKDLQISDGTNARERLQSITKPTLVIVGEKDLPYFHNIAKVLANGIAGARQVTVPNAGHMVNMEAPDTINHLITEFIAGT